MRKKIKPIPQMTYTDWLACLEEFRRLSIVGGLPTDPIDIASIRILSEATDILLRHRKNKPAILFISGRPYCEICGSRAVRLDSSSSGSGKTQRL